ncbi:hypothetical protein BGZ58_010862 [Dissophora ornata]|nr:hypothetical protein BGZ58_010862 [Dissophora ornata]
MGPGPLMQGNMGPMMLHPHHPHHPHHHHAYPHHLNTHRFGPGPGVGHVFRPNFHQPPPPPPMMSMMHGVTAPPPIPPLGGQFNMGHIPPLFGGNNFSPSLLIGGSGGGGPGSGAEFSPSEESVRNNPSSLPSTDISATGGVRVATSPSQFETQTSAGGGGGGGGGESSTASSADFSSFDSVLPEMSLSTTQPYPFLPAQLGPIGKPGTGVPAGIAAGIGGAGILSVSSGTAEDDFVQSGGGGYQYQTGHHYLPYHFGNPMSSNIQQINDEDDGNGDDQEGQQELEGHDLNGAEFGGHDTFSPGFYMYPGFLQQHPSQQQQQQKFQQPQQQQQQQHQHEQQQQQSPVHGYSPYQDQYLPDQYLQEHQTRNGGALGGGNNVVGGVIGGLGGSGLGHGHGYPNQPEWVAPQFMMGLPHHHHHPHHLPHPHHQAMYGLPQFGQYGGGQYGGLMQPEDDENEDENEGYQQQQHHQQHQQDNEYVEA